MKTANKIFIVLVLGVLLPFSGAVLIETVLSKFGTRWEVKSLNDFRFISLAVSTIASGYIIFKNRTSGINKTGWYVWGGLFAILSIGLFFTIYSLSRFGF